MAKTTMLSY